jgi:hypothetical protein
VEPRRNALVYAPKTGPVNRLYYFKARMPSCRRHFRRIADGQDLWTLPIDFADSEHPKPGTPEPFLQTDFEEYEPAFSPDG